MFETILFDLDGTISDSGYGITRCVQHALSHFGIHEELESLTCFVGPPLTDMFMEKYGMDITTAHRATELFRQRYVEKGIFENRAYDGIDELVRDLGAAGRRLALATSKPEVFAVKIMEDYGFADCFEVMVGSELDGSRVEKGEVISEALHRLRLTEKDSAVMVGDTRYDILGAKSHGLKSIGVGYGYGGLGELEQAGADLLAATVCDLRRLLL